MRWLLLLVAACSSTPKRSQPASSTTPIANQATPPEPRRLAVAGRQLALEWNLTPGNGDVTLSLRIGVERILVGTFKGDVYPAWQSYCDTKMGLLPARNVAFAEQHGALSKLTVVVDPTAKFEDPTPKGSTTLLIKRPAKERLELWKLGDAGPGVVIAIAPDARVEEVIEDEDDRPGFHCGLDDGMNN